MKLEGTSGVPEAPAELGAVKSSTALSASPISSSLADPAVWRGAGAMPAEQQQQQQQQQQQHQDQQQQQQQQQQHQDQQEQKQQHLHHHYQAQQDLRQFQQQPPGQQF
ncbi:MAG: hypothetical protein WDW38_003847 [Sanguina aurantia]